ncbi:MAG: hypothetical protein ACI3XJ_11675 [Oscillospiraceae bacterium]
MAHQLFNALLSVGLLVGAALLLDLPACRLECAGQRPGRQLARVDDQRNRAPGNIFLCQ